MTLTTVTIVTIFAALLNGFAVTGVLKILWSRNPERRQPAYATTPNLHPTSAGLTTANPVRSWVDLTTMDTRVVRYAAPARTPVPVLSWGENTFSPGHTLSAALIRELGKSPTEAVVR